MVPPVDPAGEVGNLENARNEDSEANRMYRTSLQSGNGNG